MNKKELFSYAQERGVEELEIYQSANKQTKVMMFNQSVDTFTISESIGISVRGIYNGKMGYAYTEKVDETTVKYLVDTIIDTAEVIENEDVPEIFGGEKEYVQLNQFNDDFNKVDIKEKIEMAFELERKIKAEDERIFSVNYLMYQEGETEVSIANTKGLDVKKTSNNGVVYASALAKGNDDTRSSADYVLSNDFADFDIDKLSKTIVKEATSLLGAKACESGQYKAVLRNDVSATLLSAFGGIFSAQNVQDGVSHLKGKLNQKIAADVVTLVDDPHNPDYKFGSSFDDEGVATKYKEVIGKGVLNTYLYNLKTARKDGVKPTGNGFKGSYKGSVNIKGTNFYFKPGEKSLEELLVKVGNGIFITDVAGAHSGTNMITGDFSLQASGFLVKDGKVDRPVALITISGNYFKLMNQIQEFASDVKFGFGGYGSPSVLVDDLIVSG